MAEFTLRRLVAGTKEPTAYASTECNIKDEGVRCVAQKALPIQLYFKHVRLLEKWLA